MSLQIKLNFEECKTQLFGTRTYAFLYTVKRNFIPLKEFCSDQRYCLNLDRDAPCKAIFFALFYNTFTNLLIVNSVQG